MPRLSPRPSAARTKTDGVRLRPYALTSLFALALACLAAGLAPFASSAAGASGRTLSLEERVAFQRAVEEVYWRRTIWPSENKTPKPSLDAVVTVDATRAKVEDTLRKSQALARQWGRPVTAEQLQAEMTRMARETRQPETLRELFAALGDDPFVIAEVLARPALVERLARNSFEADAKAARAETAGADAADASFDGWWEGARQQFDAETAAADEGFDYQLARVGGATADDTWSPTQALPVATGSAVWTGAEVIVWGGLTQYGGRTNSGSRYNPATDTWSSTGTVGAPRERAGHAAYWTGTEMLIWGGVGGTFTNGDGPSRPDLLNTGGRYNPLTDTWTPTSTAGAPFTSGLTVWTGSKLLVWGGSNGHIYDPSSDTWRTTARVNSPGPGGQRAVWTGTEMFVWGAIDNDTGKRGGLYNPETNTWRQPNTFNAPSERNGFSMVWTGREAVVWGGFEGNNVTLNTGGRYNPATDTWTPTSTANAPAARYGHVAVWTGSEMVVHGGDLRVFGQLGPTNTGARYNPLNDSWAAISTAGSPVKFQHVAVWTGSEVFVWGGSTGSGSFMKEGARFNPSNDTWTPVNNNDSPLYLDRGVWTGAEMLVWGQNTLCNCFTSVGGRYDPATNVWRPMNLAGAPVAGAKGHGTNAVWTGREMLVWGGGRGRYNPQTDTWAAISSTGAPDEGFTAVWSGSEMIVWGSSSTQGGANTGGRYNPDTDTWRPTSTAGAPAGRYMHTAVWTGSEMIVWGGATAGVAGKHNTGGRYNPQTDTWRPTSTAGAPEGRLGHTAVWAGSVMVVWGGSNDAVPASESRLNTGGRYDPAADAWTPTSTAGAPAARADHRAVWTGSQMIVWGGVVKGVAGADATYTGARYNPQTDLWTPTSTLSAPSKRSQHVQVWTGSQMIVWGGAAEEGAATHGAVYNAPGAPRAGNVAPAVSLTAPAGGARYQSGDTVQLAAEVSDPDGAVTAVRFYANGQLVASDTQAPFAFAWNDVRGGDYALTALATDDGAAEGRAAEVNISVAPSTAPPACVLTAPADGSAYAFGASVRMEATMTPNRDRSVARVEFLVDGRMVSYYEPPTYNPPYSHLYTADAAGARSLAARCTDNMGGVTTSAPRVVNVEEQGFSVSGQVTDDRRVAIANVRLRLDGPAGTAPVYTTTTVGGMGNYHFGGLKPGQTYTVTPEAPGFRFLPASATYPAIAGSKTGQDFTATRVGHAITGKLTDAGGAPLYPATVYLSGAKNAYTNVLSDGTYFFYNLEPGGAYNVQPYKNLHTFEPGHRAFSNLSADQTADFKGTTQGQTVTVSGRVVDGKGAGVAGMVVKLSASNDRNTTTGADGRYSFAGVPYGVNIGVYPSDPSNTYRFTPVSQFKANVAQDYVVPDFVAAPLTYIISGVVRDGAGGGIPGVTVTLGGAATGATTTGSDGAYLFRDLPGGDYTVRPSKDGYGFTPQALTFTAVRNNQPFADFTGAPATPTPTPTPAPTPSPTPAPTPSPTPAPTPSTGRVNYALASNGATATASSQYSASFPVASAINGDRRSLQVGAVYNMWHGASKAKPDWLEVNFGGEKTIDEVNVFTQRDDFESGVAPTESDTFTRYGLRDFEIQYWDGSGWHTIQGCQVAGNDRVWRKMAFAPVTTSRVRLVVTAAADGFSRVWELEAWGPQPAPAAGRRNVALSSNGGSASASSQLNPSFPASAAVDGDAHRLLRADGRYNMWHGAAAAKPDWLEVSFAGAKAIDEVSVFTQRDNFSEEAVSTEQTTFTKYGLRDFEVQYWTGSQWATLPGGAVTGNDRVWRKFTFAAVTTTKVRVLVKAAADGYSRVWELEAWGVDAAPAPGRVNVALASNGGAAAASSQLNSSFPVASVVNGDRRSLRMADGRYNIWHGSSTAKPDWVEVTFSGAKTINEVNVVTQQDDYNNPVEPTEQTAFASYGLTTFDVQYWDGSQWVTLPGGAVAGNDRVWRKFTFAPVTTTKVRVLIRATKDGYSRVMEVEAWTP